ncbi:hypothetical protein [Loigolactobacillus binensis]|uniref:ABC transporter permease n=1 Tax=Loigolactobacillus binensis TaxID=2559922 RepID=A0ABW3E9W8_9LACO|nr:hypothetical protein [Loigolactobacillus binensis]
MKTDFNFKTVFKQLLFAKWQRRVTGIFFGLDLVLTILLLSFGTTVTPLTASYSALDSVQLLYVGVLLPLYWLTKVAPPWLTARGVAQYRRLFWVPVAATLCTSLLVALLLIVLPLSAVVLANVTGSFGGYMTTWLGLLFGGVTAFVIAYFLLVLALVVFQGKIGRSVLLFAGLASGFYVLLTKVDEWLFDALVLNWSISLLVQTSVSQGLRVVIILVLSGLSFALFRWRNGVVVKATKRPRWRWLGLGLVLVGLLWAGGLALEQAQTAAPAKSSHSAATKQRGSATASHKTATGQITPYSSFSDAMKTTRQSSVVSNRFVPTSGQIPLTDSTKGRLLAVRPLVLSRESSKWMDSQLSLDQAWVAKFQPTQIDMGNEQVKVDGAVIFKITIKTGKYDNFYYPSQGRLVTNLGTSYEPVASFIMDGGMPRHKNRSQYVYFCFKQSLDDVQQVTYFRYSFQAAVGDEETEKLADHSVTVEFDNNKQPLKYGAPIAF